jgi:hypothetical protein
VRGSGNDRRNGRRRSSRAAARRERPCRHRSARASLRDYEAEAKARRVCAGDAGPSARSQGATDCVVQGLASIGPSPLRRRRTESGIFSINVIGKVRGFALCSGAKSWLDKAHARDRVLFISGFHRCPFGMRAGAIIADRTNPNRGNGTRRGGASYDACLPAGAQSPVDQSQIGQRTPHVLHAGKPVPRVFVALRLLKITAALFDARRRAPGCDISSNKRGS